VLRAQIEESLRRTAHRHHGPYSLHRFDPQTPLEQTLEVIASYRERGQIRHMGLSEVGVEPIERAWLVVPVAAVQNHSEVRWGAHGMASGRGPVRPYPRPGWRVPLDGPHAPPSRSVEQG
jgi:hypothetical protein